MGRTTRVFSTRSPRSLRSAVSHQAIPAKLWETLSPSPTLHSLAGVYHTDHQWPSSYLSNQKWHTHTHTRTTITTWEFLVAGGWYDSLQNDLFKPLGMLTIFPRQDQQGDLFILGPFLEDNWNWFQYREYTVYLHPLVISLPAHGHTFLFHQRQQGNKSARFVPKDGPHSTELMRISHHLGPWFEPHSAHDVNSHEFSHEMVPKNEWTWMDPKILQRELWGRESKIDEVLDLTALWIWKSGDRPGPPIHVSPGPSYTNRTGPPVSVVSASPFCS